MYTSRHHVLQLEYFKMLSELMVTDVTDDKTAAIWFLTEVAEVVYYIK